MSIHLVQVLDALREAGLVVPPDAGRGNPKINGVRQDSRAVEAGDLFVAWKGAAFDSHEFLPDVARSGATAAIVERIVPEVDLVQIVVDNARLAAAVVADVVAGSPWRSMQTIGVTGTNGKTTTALILRSLMSGSGPTAAIGTLGLTLPDGSRDPATEGLTTPGPVQIAEWLALLLERGSVATVMETSSHALAQFRLDGVRFDAMVFTNLTRDHLDYHEGWDEYLAAKGRLLDLAKPEGVAVFNADDSAWGRLTPRCEVLTYGFHEPADLAASDIRFSPRDTSFELIFRGDSAKTRIPLLGQFNVSNALAAAAAALALGCELSAVAEALAVVPQIPGRMERVQVEGLEVVIDFAHTPDALARVLETLRPLVDGRLIVVFGAGGDRDRAKRPKMGQAVSTHADLAVVTSDNPRTEDPDRIASEVFGGVAGVRAEKIVDRRAAIVWALGEARSGDMVVLAGKGHETYQVVGTEKQPFDESRIVSDFFAGRVDGEGGAQ